MAPPSIVVGAAAAALNCIPQTFHNPNISGLGISSISAHVVNNWSLEIPQGLYTSHEARNVTDVSFCNVTVTSTHPGWNDTINTQLWLPLDPSDWNGRLQMTGGGGLVTGLLYTAMTGALSDGYASVSTDGGHNSLTDLSVWGLYEDQNPNLYNVLDFAQNSLHEAAVMGKTLTKDFYGKNVSYSYYTGCSTGGRQGLAIAQNYPEDFDGILASAPALKWNDIAIQMLYPMVNLLDQHDGFPNQCELDALTAAAVEACDPKDGVTDGIISAPELCDLDPLTMVGRSIPCGTSSEGHVVNISRIAAIGAKGAWYPVEQSGTALWLGFGQQAQLGGLMNTTTTTTTTNSPSGVAEPEPVPFGPSVQWLACMLKHDPAYDWRTNYNVQQMYEQLKSPENALYRGILSADNPDLSKFRDAGGKMITWQGMADDNIPTAESQDYYQSVEAHDPDVRDYYRYFQPPGIGHCLGGPGFFPGQTFENLVDWVEHGRAPDSLLGVTQPDFNGVISQRPICLYPKRAKYDGEGEVTAAGSWTCQ